MTERLLFDSGEPFATGGAKFLDTYPGSREGHARIYVQFSPEGAGYPLMALLDTGGHYCILNKDVAASIQGHFGECFDEVDLRTAYGLIRGSSIATESR